MKCFYHPQTDAVGQCSNCQKGICSRCAVHVDAEYGTGCPGCIIEDGLREIPRVRRRLTKLWVFTGTVTALGTLGLLSSSGAVAILSAPLLFAAAWCFYWGWFPFWGWVRGHGFSVTYVSSGGGDPAGTILRLILIGLFIEVLIFGIMAIGLFTGIQKYLKNKRYIPFAQAKLAQMYAIIGDPPETSARTLPEHAAGQENSPGIGTIPSPQIPSPKPPESPNLIKCTCGTLNDRARTTCRECGKALHEIPQSELPQESVPIVQACPTCGKQTRVVGAVFCAYCGEKFVPGVEAKKAEISQSHLQNTQETQRGQSNSAFPPSPEKRGNPLVYGGIISLILVSLLLVSLALNRRAPSDTTQKAISSSPPTEASSPSSNASATTVTVQANQDWQDSGISVQEGQQITIQYVSGQWTSDPSVSPFDGNGRPDGYTCANYEPASQCAEVVPDAVQGSLVGRIGTETLKIRNGGTFTATQAGSLLLRINDGSGTALDDNQGSIRVQINISSTNTSVAPTPTAITFVVQANQGWQDSGIAVVSGQKVMVERVSGFWTDHIASYAPFDGNGQPDGYACAHYLPASQCGEADPYATKGALIGKIGSQVVSIGNDLAFSARETGELFLRMNDGDGHALDDNQGAITVSVTIA